MQLKTIRLVSYVEGISLLLLFLVAMPLKYYFGLPLAVRVVGSLHGLLFVILMGVLFYSRLKRTLEWKAALSVFALSFVPFGFIEAERMMKRLETAA